ncbi:hypothetical protein PF005_g22700 [Phytophthora fragariae]|uniref:Uncharacterized protein n=1 Tax=Phytophthora fragariae TaxID=53985 RepID=A0A6A3EA28_9STRA|nr:hypothetical protein PF009_g23021 [Phytophthora fragariae]KAE9088659.1 hypothetical protein PF006_g25530 [Phytophthora fragariae]KAE9181912.1 hypothetical protein PF005_g22700 [Phytophthora fragariae]KAE9284812.1 hypothetical protein PF001_g22202 [Phytophthora fragariae]
MEMYSDLDDLLRLIDNDDEDDNTIDNRDADFVPTERKDNAPKIDDNAPKIDVIWPGFGHNDAKNDDIHPIMIIRL